MSSALKRARGLVRKSDHDFAIAKLGLRHREALDMVCFPLQALYPSAQEAESALDQAERFRTAVRELLPPEVPGTQG